MKNLLLTFCMLVFTLVIISCEDDDGDTLCESGAIVHEFTDYVSAVYLYNLDESRFFIRYSVPGTIDSIYDGYLCHELITDFNLTENLQVKFTGKFSELPDNSNLTSQVGGQEIFLLEVTGIKPDK